ncbi:hypothetical protein AC1031_009002 [Aphanomyces cochlioides]|nr:hypothetical protein AC1031_009002 [Aphanomyces cochlioides]
MGMALSILREKNPDATLDVFTIAFDDEAVHGQYYDESQSVVPSMQMRKFNVFHATQEAMTDVFEDAVWHWEAPMIDFNGTAKFLLSKYVRDAGYKVVLTGEGSDEHFAGYAFFQTELLREPTTPPTVSDAFRHEKLAQAEAVTRAHRGRSLLNNVSSTQFVTITGCMFPPMLKDKTLFASPGEAFAHSLTAVERQKAKITWHPLHTALAVQTRTCLSTCMCTHLGDRSEMAHSIEGRVPFLDYRLTTYVNGLPPRVKIHVDEATRSNTDKWITPSRQAIRLSRTVRTTQCAVRGTTVRV